MIYHCCDARRRELVLADPVLNGIDFIEVLDGEAPAPTPRQHTLLVRFLKPAPALGLINLDLSGGERITDVGIEWVTPANAPDLTLIDPIEAGLPGYLSALPLADHVLALRTDSAGDFSDYTLRLVAGPGALTPPAGIDRLLSEVVFSFKVECPTDFDCAPRPACEVEVPHAPAISYLAKDYRSFRRLMLNRMAQIMPDWRERSPADLGVTLVEMLAFTADRLSYAQDAVGAEAYLATARRRSSVRRHARLVDYAMHDGGNARVWVALEAGAAGGQITPGADSFLTRLSGFSTVIAPDDRDRALGLTPQVFEPMHDKTLFAAHNTMDFYDWGDAACCLPKGATRATLMSDLPDLAVGDVLIIEERLGPRTGLAADADPAHRHAVRLTAVQAGLSDVLTGQQITEIRWADEDRLPFAVCISSVLDSGAGGGTVTGVSHALGNVVLADHGRRIENEDLPEVPAPHLSVVSAASGDPCDHAGDVPVPPRYRPVLSEEPVTQAGGFDAAAASSAFGAMQVAVDTRRPVLRLDPQGGAVAEPWTTRRDLLQSGADDPHFVLETERNGSARLRFGDDRNGRRPLSGTRFVASYRVGNGPDGNIGADALAHAFTAQNGLVGLRNPLPAQGGIAPESMEEVRLAAPVAYRRQERAVTAEDYGEIARRYPDVQRAVATFRWNGHGHTVFVTVDRFGGRPVSSEFEAGLSAFLDRFRMAGYDLEIDAPRFVALELGLFICAHPQHFRSDIRREVLEVLGTGVLSGGRKAHFHPDNLSFGAPVYLSAIYAAVMAVEGVTSVKATQFRKRGTTSTVPLQDGVIELGRLEIAQLENSRNYPERGAIRIEMGGGK